MADHIEIPRRFNGPPDSGHGGYSCGAVAALVGNPAEVTLRSPPPLERRLRVERSDGEVTVLDGDALVAEGRPVDLDLEVPDPVSLDEATEGNREGHRLFTHGHPFPTCLVCGPERERSDGFGVMAGAIADGLFAADWTPDRWLAGPDGEVPSELVWAVLDCPSSSPVANAAGGPPIVLARLAARLEAPVRAGEPHVAIAWLLGVDGRKRSSGSALFTADGERVAAARALWIEPRPQPGAA